MRPPRRALQQAFDEARFGPARTLNLRATLPTVAQAAARAEAWLREKQASRVEEVLIITGRGNRSPGGVSPVREAIAKLLRSLGARGVVARTVEHTPGSFVVTLAPARAHRGSAAPRPDHAPPAPPAPPADPRALAGLAASTRAMLRELACRSLAELGVRDPAPFIEGEMVARFAAIAAGVPEGPRREARLREAIRAALDATDER